MMVCGYIFAASFGLPLPAWGFPLTLALEPALGQRGLRLEVWPNFQGDSWKQAVWSPIVTLSTPTPVIWPSMCQSRRPLWQVRDDTDIVCSPYFPAWTFQMLENVPVIMAFQCQLACWVWPEPWDWRGRDKMCVSFGKFTERCWGFWHTATVQDHTCSGKQTIIHIPDASQVIKN